MVTYSDDFESYTDGNALSVASDWATATLSGSGVPTIDTHTDHKSGQVVDMSTTGVAVCVYQSAMSGADHWAEVEAFPDCGDNLVDAGSINGNGPVVRLQDSAATTPDGYFARWTTTRVSGSTFTMTLALFKVESGAWTLLQESSDLSGTYRVDGTSGQVPQTVRLTADGSSLSGEVEGVEVVTATDTTFASGSYVGAWHDRTVSGARWQPFFDDFAAEDVSSGSTQLVVAGLDHTVTLDGVDLVQAHTLTAAGLDHTVALDGVTLVVAGALEVQPLDHTVTLDQVTLTQAHTLTAASLDHTVTLDGDLVLVEHTAGSLLVQPLDLAVTLDQVTLAQAHTLTAASLDHTVTLDGDLVLSMNAIDLVVAPLTLFVTVDQPQLAVTHVLVAQDMLLAVSLGSAESVAWSVWLDGVEVPCTLEGVWDGTQVRPVDSVSVVS